MAIDLQGGKGGKKGRVRPVMNVTPLVDVVLVLLIIFMVITPMLYAKLSVNVPVDESDDAPADAGDGELAVVLSVDASGEIKLGRDAVSDGELPGKLRRVFAARDDQTLFFDADDDAPYGRALEVIDIARGAGLVTIAVLTSPLES